jgi:hypothetical protein
LLGTTFRFPQVNIEWYIGKYIPRKKGISNLTFNTGIKETRNIQDKLCLSQDSNWAHLRVTRYPDPPPPPKKGQELNFRFIQSEVLLHYRYLFWEAALVPDRKPDTILLRNLSTHWKLTKSKTISYISCALKQIRPTKWSLWINREAFFDKVLRRIAVFLFCPPR